MTERTDQMSWTRYAERLQQNPVLFLPVGAHEQHGPHLPMGTDAIFATRMAEALAARLDGIPGLIVHGRYDVICPLENAWELHHAWSGSELSIVADGGHAATEPGIRGRLEQVEFTDASHDVVLYTDSCSGFGVKREEAENKIAR